MAEWSREKVNAENLNGGQEYKRGNRISRQQLNAIVNNSLYASDTAESANTKSGNAVSVANEAKTIAQGINNKAQSALDTANSANTTANTANTIATNVNNSAVHKTGDENIEGIKNFTGTFQINGSTISYDASTNTFTI